MSLYAHEHQTMKHTHVHNHGGKTTANCMNHAASAEPVSIIIIIMAICNVMLPSILFHCPPENASQTAVETEP